MDFAGFARTGSGDCALDFRRVEPARSSRGAEINGRSVPFRVQANSVDQHVTVLFPLHRNEQIAYSCPKRLRSEYRPGVAAAGESSQAARGIRVMDAGRDQLALQISGISGKQYAFACGTRTR